MEDQKTNFAVVVYQWDEETYDVAVQATDEVEAVQLAFTEMEKRGVKRIKDFWIGKNRYSYTGKKLN